MRRRLVGCCLLYLACSPPFAAAQSPAPSDRRPLAGTIRDSSGAAIPQAIVSATREPSRLEQISKANDRGEFSFGELPRGRYRLTVSADGFAPAIDTVDVPATGALTFTLRPAAVLEQVTVTSASRQDELRASLNTSVDVVTRARIEESGAQTVGEVLREIPGVLTRRNSEGAGVAGEQIQGIDSRQVLVLLDGQPIAGARGIKSGIINLDRQSTARVERVEVVKGAASALYGSDAIGGVINLISRDAAAPVSVGGEVSGGSLGEVNAVVDAGVRRQRWSAFVVGERHEQDGFDLTPTTFDTTGAAFTRRDFLGRARAQPGTGVQLAASLSGYVNDANGRANGEQGPQETDTREEALTFNATLDWALRPGTALQARGYAATYDETSTGRLAPPASTPIEPGAVKERLLKLDASAAHVLTPWQQLQAGVELSDDEYSGLNRVRNDDGESASTRVGWAQYRASLGSRVVATLGGRVDNHSEFGSAFSPKAAANVRVVNGVNLRASIGRGFRAPDVGQLFYRFLNPTNLYQVIGNPNLRPEYATSIQAGGELAAGGRARLGINLFRNDVRDLINSVSLGFVATPEQLAALLESEHLDAGFRPVVGRLFFTYKNVAEAVTEGVEVDGTIALTRALSFGGAYTRLDARDDATGLALTGRHEHQGHVRAAWSAERIGLKANLRGTFYSSWISARATVNGAPVDTRAPGFALWDAFVSQRIGRGVSAFAAVDNITDNQDPATGQTTATGAPASMARLDAGRTVRVGVRFGWTR